MRLLSRSKLPFLVAFCSLLSVCAAAQSRINDKDLEALMRNLRDDAKSFRQPFSSALKRSTIRKTSQAKDAENLAALFEKQTETLLNNFKQTKKGDANLSAVEGTSQQLGMLVRNYAANSQVAPRWDKIQAELQQVLSAYGIAQPNNAYDNPRGVTPDPAPSASGGEACSQAVGTERANRLVQECLDVSPATHPPCNAQNSCILMIDEIKRGCSLLGNKAPIFCSEYR
jgi:hypothetical protein